METKQLSTDEKKSKAKSNRRRLHWLAGPLIALITIILFLGTLELVAYFWERNTAQGPLGWTLVASRRMPPVRYGSDDQPYFLLEPNQGYIWEGIPVHINSRGFRTEEFAIPKPPDTYRILNLGDSVAFGWEVREEDTYGQQLAEILNQQTDGRNYEVINAGVPGWSLNTERNFLEQEGLNYQPDLVLLDLTIVNDIYAEDSPNEEKRFSLFDWLRDNTYAWPFLTIQTRFLLSKQYGPEAIPVLNPGTNPEFYFPLDKNDSVWDKQWRVIAEMHQAAKEQGAEFVIVAFPTALQVNSSAHPNIPQQVFGDRAREKGINFVDLTPVFQEACEGINRSDCEGFENKLFADVWMHPTKLGHELAAQHLAKVLNES